MNVIDLSRANYLNNEAGLISRAIESLDAGGTVVQMVLTGHINLPAPPHSDTMLAALRAALLERQATIRVELNTMGVT